MSLHLRKCRWDFRIWKSWNIVENFVTQRASKPASNENLKRRKEKSENNWIKKETSTLTTSQQRLLWSAYIRGLSSWDTQTLRYLFSAFSTFISRGLALGLFAAFSLLLLILSHFFSTDKLSIQTSAAQCCWKMGNNFERKKTQQDEWNECNHSFNIII